MQANCASTALGWFAGMPSDKILSPEETAQGQMASLHLSVVSDGDGGEHYFPARVLGGNKRGTGWEIITLYYH